MNAVASPRRGRPPKFGRPSQVVALTLPEEVVQGLRRIDADIGWAIVKLFERQTPRAAGTLQQEQPVAELVAVGERRCLIVVDRSVFRSLPGVSIVPLQGDSAFLALDPGHGLADLELAVIDRLDNDTVGRHERDALKELRAQLRRWRQDASLRFHSRAIIVVERVRRRASRTAGSRA